MNYEINLFGGAGVNLIVTLRGSGVVSFDATLELRGPVRMLDRRSATGDGHASAVFDLNSFPPPSVGTLTINARSGEGARAARIEVREGDREPWVHSLEIPHLDVPLVVGFVLVRRLVAGGDESTAAPPETAAHEGSRAVEAPAGAVTSKPGVPMEEAPEDRVYGVWFGTNRTPVIENDKVVDFGPQLADEISYGHCEVFVPLAHRLGETGSLWYARLFRGDDRLRVRQVDALAEGQFWRRITEQLAAAGVGSRHAVVFIHGYNVDFQEAAIRAAQLGCDLKITGPMAFFSWASRGTTVRYTTDEATIEESEHDIEDFLVDFATKLKPDAVHVIAHSMGNRAVLRMVDRVVGRAAAGSPVRFGQLILAAPDVTPGLFRQIAERYRRVAERTTIYVSSRDKALALSNIVHGRRRVGDSAAGVFVVDGIDTVVASEIDAGFLGHFAPSAREVLSDLHDLLHRGTPAAQRFGMRVVEAGFSRYYVIRE